MVINSPHHAHLVLVWWLCFWNLLFLSVINAIPLRSMTIFDCQEVSVEDWFLIQLSWMYSFCYIAIWFLSRLRFHYVGLQWFCIWVHHRHAATQMLILDGIDDLIGIQILIMITVYRLIIELTLPFFFSMVRFFPTF